MFSVKNVSQSFGNQEIFKDISFKIGSSERVGLIGDNGSGKSTLLRMLSGVMEPDSGRIEKKSKIGYLTQEVPKEFLNKTGVVYLKGIDNKILETLGLTKELLSQKLNILSGGERSKIALAKVLSEKHESYLLDEPTNNLDLDALNWLEKYILDSEAIFIIISHDRKFLDNTVNKIIAIDSHTKNIKIYGGNYSYYREKKQEELENQEREYEAYLKKVESFKGSIAEKKVWAKTGHESPNTTDNDRLLAGVMSDRSTKIFKNAKNLEKRLEKFEENGPSVPPPKKKFVFEFLTVKRSGTLVFEAQGVGKKFETVTIGPIDIHVEYGDKIAITGLNGVGKSTLIEILSGVMTTDLGKLQIGQSLSIGYLSQKPLDEDKTVIESMLAVTKDINTEARKILSRFELKDNDVTKKISILSPGERSRLILARLVATQPNCLLLDEPSNHLDIEALEALENAIREFSGTVIVVTHDRYFLERIKPSKIIEIKR
jgi:macrolide transport system ATP-binding/permease protein